MSYDSYKITIIIVFSMFFLFFLQEIHKKVEIVDCTHWKEPKLIVKILLHYFVQNKSSIDLLFQLLRALCDRFIPDFQVCNSKLFLLPYISVEVTYSI